MSHDDLPDNSTVPNGVTPNQQGTNANAPRRFEWLPITKVVPNEFNPNELTEEQEDQYATEVERTERLPKATLVHPLPDGNYEIIDGEHGWRIAKKLGMDKILCEIIEADAFESMLRCYKHNLSGTNNPFKLGEMFAKMLAARQLSIRQLAKEAAIPASTIRSYLQFVEVYKVRSAYAGEECGDEIAQLTHAQVTWFLRLHPDIANPWLDSGGDINALPTKVNNIPIELAANVIRSYGLQDFLRHDSGFRSSLENLCFIAQWAEKHKGILDLRAYLMPVAENDLPQWVLDQLPISRHDDGTLTVLITPDQWRALIVKCSEFHDDPSGLLNSVTAGVRLALKDAGIDPRDHYSPRIVEQLDSLAEAPDFIRDAQGLSLEEQCFLACQLRSDESKNARTAAKRTIKSLRKARSEGRGRRGRDPDQPVAVTFFDHLENLAKEQDDAMFSDKDKEHLVDGVINVLGDPPAVELAATDNVSRVDVLRERLGKVDLPELWLLASLAKGEGGPKALLRWTEGLNKLS